MILAFFYGQSRIFFVMARDGLLPPGLARVSGRGSPVRITIFTAIVVAVLAGIIPLAELAALANAGTLTAFIAVCVCMLVMRRRAPDAPRRFRTPLAWPVGLFAILGCLYLLYSLPQRTQIWFVRRACRRARHLSALRRAPQRRGKGGGPDAPPVSSSPSCSRRLQRSARRSAQPAAGPRRADDRAKARSWSRSTLRAPRSPPANFLRYVDQRRFDGANFYRAMRGGPDRGLVQGGAGPSPAVRRSRTSRPRPTGLSHVEGAISIARDEPGTARRRTSPSCSAT